MNLLSHRHLPLYLAAIAVILALPSVLTGLSLDDYWHWATIRGAPEFGQLFTPSLEIFKFADGDPHRMQALRDYGLAPWWALDDLRLNFWRPVTALTHWLDYTCWPERPWLMHLHSLAWLAVGVIMVSALYRQVMGVGQTAGLAALLYAIDDAHAMPAGWLANRNGLIALLFGLAAISLHIRWRRDDKKPAGLLAPVCLLLALLSNEGAIAVCAYVFAYAVFLDRNAWPKRAVSLLPYALVVVAWRLAYHHMGFGVSGSAAYIDPVASPLAFLDALRTRGVILLLAQWIFAPAEFFPLLPAKTQFLVWTAALVLLILVAVLFIPILRRDPISRFWAMGMVLAVVPGCATFPAGRLLLFVGIGGMGLIARFIATIRDNAADRPFPSVMNKLARPLYHLLILMHLVVAPLVIPLGIVAFSLLGRHVATCIDSAPLDHSAAGKTLVVVNSCRNVYVSGLPVMNAMRGKPVPARVRNLAPNSGKPVPLNITRTDDRTLVVASPGGFPWLLVRNDDHPFAVGDQVKLAGMTVTVRKTVEQGWPAELAYEFDVPLESTSLIWLQLQGEALIPFSPPATGETVVLNKK